jgi:hypothetical protein
VLTTPSETIASRAEIVGVHFINTLAALKLPVPDIGSTEVANCWLTMLTLFQPLWSLKRFTPQAHGMQIHPIFLNNALIELQDFFERLAKVVLWHPEVILLSLQLIRPCLQRTCDDHFDPVSFWATDPTDVRA